MLIRIATRRSRLALAQSRWVQERLQALDPDLRVELREFVTEGDRVQDVPLPQVGGKGLFTREIEDALLSGEADVAVHSLKDLPSELPAGLALAAVPAREDPRDVLVLPRGDAPNTLAALPQGARIGSSSVRRAAQLLAARPDLVVKNVRGNVDTRLRKLDEGQYDALVLAAAGLRRLGLEQRISAYLSPEACTPAPGQGALALESREFDDTTRSLLALLDDPEARACVTAERALMAELGGGCSVPLGALATVEGDELRLTAVIAMPDGSRVLRAAAADLLHRPEALGKRVADWLMRAGALEILELTGPRLAAGGVQLVVTCTSQ